MSESNLYTSDDIPLLERKWDYNKRCINRYVENMDDIERIIAKPCTDSRRQFLLKRWRYLLNQKAVVEGYQLNIKGILIDIGAPGWGENS